MNKKLFPIIAAAFLVITAALFQSCTEEKYTVWTDYCTYSEFQSEFNATLNDGYYVRLEITDSQWEEISKGLSSEGRHKWDEETIKKWLIGNRFGDSEATKESSWLVLTNHGFIASRTNNMVYFILK